jgi:hypothetical protein
MIAKALPMYMTRESAKLENSSEVQRKGDRTCDFRGPVPLTLDLRGLGRISSQIAILEQYQAEKQDHRRENDAEAKNHGDILKEQRFRQ